MQQKRNYPLIIGGILFLIGAYCTLTDKEKNYEPASLYKVQHLMDGKVISTQKKTGQELNAEEPMRLVGVRIMGCLFLVCAAAIYYDQFHREKSW